MILNTDDWTTSAEAARLLNVSPQRVMQMADEDGALDVVRPWPRVALIGRRSIAEWVAGSRLPRIGPPTQRSYLRKRGIDPEGDIDTVRDALREFIEDARTRWTPGRRDLWALEMASKLQSRGLDVDVPITA